MIIIMVHMATDKMTLQSRVTNPYTKIFIIVILVDFNVDFYTVQKTFPKASKN